jgi:hypothetical protein
VADGGTVVDNAVNRATIFMFGPAPAGHTRHGKYRNNQGAPLGAYDMNNVAVPGALSVTSFAPIKFDSANFNQNQTLMNEVAQGIEKGLIKVVDVTALGVALTRTNLAAFV